MPGPPCGCSPTGGLLPSPARGASPRPRRSSAAIARRWFATPPRSCPQIAPTTSSRTRSPGALPGIETGDAELHLRPWLYTIVRNAALNHLRDTGPPHEQIDENYDGVEQPPQALERREGIRELVTSMQELPETQREALVKREMEGLSHAEIGTEMGL